MFPAQKVWCNLFPRTVAKMNTVVMLHADTPLPLAALARAARLAYTPAASALATLEKRGLVRRTSRAGQDEFAPNRESPYFPMAYATALVDLPLAEALRGQRVMAGVVYGSLAKPGGGTRASDLDILLVGDVRDRERLVNDFAELGSRLARHVDPFILTPEQFERARRRGDEHVASALSGVRLFGIL